ncbi:Rpn family recombination-promoting nuclease/putative transposase [Magnetovirga frankeli]|uniref:Rpn family recombination-promoting nuclease/putative transposase n=1 Tax=Magnetovirga frankeli TaxID=947516 RepID=UPI003D332A1A
MSNHHDIGYKHLFSIPEMVRDLILGFIPDAWLHSLDLNTLEKVSGHYVSEDFQKREDDVVWRIQVGKEWLCLYLLIEFQSTDDPHMALRMMVYVGLLYQDLIKAKAIKPGDPLPPVLPIVLYNGGDTWKAKTQIADLTPPGARIGRAVQAAHGIPAHRRELLPRQHTQSTGKPGSGGLSAGAAIQPGQPAPDHRNPETLACRPPGPAQNLCPLDPRQFDAAG